MVDEFNALDFEEFPALIWRAGLDGKCDYFNRTWLEFTGRPLARELGNGWTEGVHPDDLAQCMDTYVVAFGQQVPFSMEYRLRHHSGEYRWIKDMGTPRRNRRGEFLGYLGSCYDVTTERNSARQLQKLNQNKSRLFSLVAHDLKGPVGAMEHLTRSLADHELADEDRELAIQALAGATARTYGFLENLLTWARTQLEGFHPTLTSVDIPSLVRESTEPLYSSLAEKHQTLTLGTTPADPVQGDPDLLRTVFRNLVSNAAKFSPDGAPILVSWNQVPGGLEVRVEDRGIGIPPAVLDEVANSKPTVSRPGTAGERGSGLGLMICREFLEVQGGDLRVESTEGQGTTVVVRLTQCVNVHI